jgi:hypothetical protein
MKRILTFLLLFFLNDDSFAQNDITIHLSPNPPPAEEEKYNSGANIEYLTAGTSEHIQNKFKNYLIKISANKKTGVLLLQINSPKNREVLLELQNIEEDEVFFQAVNLEKGNNIIRFEFENTSVAYTLKLGKFNSNRTSSFLLLKQ